MWWVIGLLGAVVFIAVVAPQPPGRRGSQQHASDDDTSDDAWPDLMDDPIGALTLYGTDADAERLTRLGYGEDLAGLGWKPPKDHG